jgi:hypothetical protein
MNEDDKAEPSAARATAGGEDGDAEAVHVEDIGDWFLALLVRFANQEALTVGVSLIIGGVVVSGTLVGGKEYFEGFANELADAAKDEDRELTRTAFLKYREMYDPLPEEVPVEYIHLRDAHFVYPGRVAVPTNRGVWWRGRLGEVGGWNLGELTEDESTA